MEEGGVRVRVGEGGGNVAEWLRRLSVKQLCKRLRFESWHYQMRILKEHPILSLVNGMLIDLPAPSNISYL